MNSFKIKSKNKFQQWLVWAIVVYFGIGLIYALWHEVLYNIKCDAFSGDFWLKIMYYKEPQTFYKNLGFVVAAVTTAFFTSQTVYEKYLENSFAKESKQEEVFVRASEMLSSENQLTRRTGAILLASLAKKNPEQTQRCLDFLMEINKKWMPIFQKIYSLNNGWFQFDTMNELIEAIIRMHKKIDTEYKAPSIFFDAKNRDDLQNYFEISKIFRTELPSIFRWVSNNTYFKEQPISLYKAYLCGFDFSGLTINEHFNISHANFNGANFIDCMFKNHKNAEFTNFTGASFLNSSIQNSKFHCFGFNCSDLRFLTHSNTSFVHCIFDGCILDEQDVKKYSPEKIEGEFYVQQYGYSKRDNDFSISIKLIDYNRLLTRLNTHRVTRWSSEYNGFTQKIKKANGEIVDSYGN